MSRLSIVFVILLLAGTDAPALLQTEIMRSKSLQQPGKKHSETRHERSNISVLFDCLPEELKSTDIVSYARKGAGPDEDITVADKLIELKAGCKRGALVDRKGKKIKFFKLACYGNPPSDYEEIRQKESEELEKLQKSYTVIVVECDPHIGRGHSEKQPFLSMPAWPQPEADIWLLDALQLSSDGLQSKAILVSPDRAVAGKSKEACNDQNPGMVRFASLSSVSPFRRGRRGAILCSRPRTIAEA